MTVSAQTGASPLVDPDWLLPRLPDAHLRILDIRSAVDGGGREAFERAHIPGAVYTDYAKDGWRVTKGMASGLLPDAEQASALFGRLGLSPEQHIVIVGAGNGPGDFSAAARVYWTLKSARHPLLSILDGGMAAWTRDPERPTESGLGNVPQPTRYPVSFDPAWRCDLALAQKSVAGRTAVLLDSRAASFFEGRDKSPQAKRPGRLPGAVHLDHVLAFDAARRLKPLAELRALFDGLPHAPVVNYCNTGHQAATNWFILSELLGRPGVTLYDGSMSQWTEAPERPVATG
jgi:thiosulfate/3-mercaptopyruvate sulfurtransferase